MSIWDNISADPDVYLKNQKDDPKVIKCNNLRIKVFPYGVEVDSYELKDNNLEKKLVKHFTIEYDALTYVKKIKVMRKVKTTKLLFLRFGMLEYIKRLKNINITYHLRIPPIPKNVFKWTGSLKNNQKIIVKCIMNKYFNEKNTKCGKSGCILNLEAGQGKTFIATSLIEKLKTKTLIICHNKNILRQWVKVLSAGYPNNTVKAYYGESKACGDITVGIVNSLLMDNMQINGIAADPKTFFKQFGFVVFDEVHLYSGNMRKNIYYRLYATYILGLSATPDENKCFDKINEWGCGNVLNATSIKGYTVEHIAFKGNVTKLSYKAPDEYTQIIINEKLEMIAHSSMVSQLCEDPYRIHLIVKSIFDLKEKGKNIFVFAERRSYLTAIKNHMALFKIDSHELLTDSDENHISQLMGGSTDEDVANAIKSSNVILTTYEYMGTGMSIPKMDAIILATSRKKKSKQYVGRIFRLGSNYESVREIVDIVDAKIYIKSQYSVRKKYYDEKKFPITKKTVKWQEMESEMKQMNIVLETVRGSQTDVTSKDICESQHLNQTTRDGQTVKNPLDSSLSKLEELLRRNKIV
jgi:superfamily II DNA or RNA helicase